MTQRQHPHPKRLGPKARPIAYWVVNKKPLIDCGAESRLKVMTVMKVTEKKAFNTEVIFFFFFGFIYFPNSSVICRPFSSYWQKKIHILQSVHLVLEKNLKALGAFFSETNRWMFRVHFRSFYQKFNSFINYQKLFFKECIITLKLDNKNI